MNAQILVCLALVAWPSAFGLYYERVKNVYQPPTKLREDSYFGYSITYDSNFEKLVISAPRADSIGDVYDCDIEKKSCSKIDRTNVTRPGNLVEGTRNYSHDFWFGATVKAGPDFVIMCAPRYTHYTEKVYEDFVARGRCYKHTEHSLKELRTISDDARLKDSPFPLEATMDSFGWSIDVDTGDSVIVGGPGMFHGRVMIYELTENYRVPDLISKNSWTPKYNFGYAVASGKFIHMDGLSYAVSSTYGQTGIGEVLFFKKKNGYYPLITQRISAPTPVVGSMFGAVLCAATMLGKRSDLLVGAPAYASENSITYNRGAVYVYLARVRSKAPKYHRIIVGKDVSGAMFGSAIISVGDLNNDKKDEIAIGAPFENSGQGVVYLYSGAHIISEDTSLEPLQKIKPEASYAESFGMSLTPLLDYDKNGCNEIAIGSPYTDTVVLLRCMASVNVTTSAEFPNLQGRIKSGKEDFEFKVCLKVAYPTLPDKITATIETVVEMSHDDAKLATNPFDFETSLHDKQSNYCKDVPFKLPREGKYDTEISYLISSKLKTDPRNLPEFDSSRVLLSDLSILNFRGALWAAECADKTCVPNLKLSTDISFKNDPHPYIIGSSLKETVSFTLENSGEVAYAPCVRVHIVGVNVLQPGGCEYETSTVGDKSDRLKCQPSKPLWNGQVSDSFVIELEMVHLTNKNERVNITMDVYNRCNDVVNETQTYVIPVKADPGGIFVRGETDMGSIVDMTEEEMKNLGKKLHHVYTVYNYGPTSWEELPIRVTLPKQPYINYFNDDNSSVSVSSSISADNSPCKCDRNDTIAFYCTCTVKRLVVKLESAIILVPINILNGTLEGLLDKDKNITLTSSVNIEFLDDESSRAARVFTTVVLNLKKEPVNLETIIIAVVVGLCILIIIAVILYRIGFLRRKRKEELQKLKKSVKRQTILRRSTMPSQTQSHGAEDRRQILDDMKEEEEHDQAPTLST